MFWLERQRSGPHDRASRKNVHLLSLRARSWCWKRMGGIRPPIRPRPFVAPALDGLPGEMLLPSRRDSTARGRVHLGERVHTSSPRAGLRIILPVAFKTFCSAKNADCLIQNIAMGAFATCSVRDDAKLNDPNDTRLQSGGAG